MKDSLILFREIQYGLDFRDFEHVFGDKAPLFWDMFVKEYKKNLLDFFYFLPPNRKDRMNEHLIGIGLGMGYDYFLATKDDDED